MEFPRIKRLPPYVFNVVGDLKLAARRAGEDIIDLSMGNPDGPTPPHIVQSLVESAQKPQNHRYSVSRGIYKLRVAICDWYQRRYGVEFDPDGEAIVTIGSKEGIGHLALAMLGAGDVVLCPRRRRVHPSVLGDHRQRRCCARLPLVPGRDFFENLVEATRQTWPKPKLLIINFPHNPTTEVVDLAFFRRIVEFSARARHAGRARPRLRRPGVRRLQAAELPAGEGGEGGRRRVLHAVEELQHAGLARRLRGRQPGDHRRAGTHEELPRLRHLPAGAGPPRQPRSTARRTASPRSARSTATVATCCATA
jgi:hypothetical protein